MWLYSWRRVILVYRQDRQSDNFLNNVALQKKRDVASKQIMVPLIWNVYLGY